MSVNAMTNAALARRSDYPPASGPPGGTLEIAAAAGGASPPQSSVTAALAVIVTYIPTEVLTLYIAVLAAIKDPQPTSQTGVWIASWIFLIATPLVVWLVYAAKLKSDDKPLPLSLKQWPWWEMVAGTIAYIAWAFALPDAPFLKALGLPTTLAAVIVLVTAAILGLLAPIFQRPIKSSDG